MPDRQLNVFVFDGDGVSIRGARVTALHNDKAVASAEISGEPDLPVRLILPETVTSIKLRAEAWHFSKEDTVDSAKGNFTFRFEEIHINSERPVMHQRSSIIMAFVFGVSFISIIVAIAVFIPNPTEFQYNIFKTVLALAGAGVSSVIPGILNVQIKKFITAGGALAVFVVLYFYSPASLVVKEIRSTTETSTNVLTTNITNVTNITNKGGDFDRLPTKTNWPPPKATPDLTTAPDSIDHGSSTKSPRPNPVGRVILLTNTVYERASATGGPGSGTVVSPPHNAPTPPAIYTLTVVDGAGSGSYTGGAIVNISANDTSNQDFAYWSGPAIADTNQANTVVSMPGSNLTVTAYYRPHPPANLLASPGP